MKKIILFFVAMTGLLPAAFACKLCEEEQPAFLRGAVHGPGPQGPWDYVIMIASMVIVLVVLVFSIKFLVKPGEKDPDHVKYSILNANDVPYGK